MQPRAEAAFEAVSYIREFMRKYSDRERFVHMLEDEFDSLIDDIAGGVLREAQGKWLMTVGDDPDIRKLYRRYPQTVLTTKMAVEKVIGGKRGRLTHLLIRNYERPRDPIYTTIASEASLMDLFGLDVSP